MPATVPQAPPPSSSFSFTLPPGRNLPSSQPPTKPFTFSLPANQAVKANEIPSAGLFAAPTVPAYQIPATTVTQMPVNQPANAGVYSVLAQMSSSYLELYKAEKFSQGKIPRPPPPQELCFWFECLILVTMSAIQKYLTEPPLVICILKM